MSDITAVKNLSPYQWATARDLAATLRPFMDVTELMSAVAYPTLSMILRVIDGLRHLVSTSSGGLDGLRAILVRLVHEKFGDIFDDDELRVATLVDPRFKLAPFDNDDRREKAKSTALLMMQDIVAKQQPTVQAADRTASPAPKQAI